MIVLKHDFSENRRDLRSKGINDGFCRTIKAPLGRLVIIVRGLVELGAHKNH